MFTHTQSIHEANAGNFEPEKRTDPPKTPQFFFANDNKIIKLKCCENFKTWKCLEVGQMASMRQLPKNSSHSEAVDGELVW